MNIRFLAIALCLPTTGLLAQQVTPPAQPAPSGGTTSASSVPIATPPPPAPATPATTATDEVVNMSVFQVTGAQDRGYQGLNTTSGSRVKTDLKDVAASISPFTEEFLSDIGATTIDDMLTYAGNVESGDDDTSDGFNNSSARQAGNLNNNFRIRGLSANVTSNYVNTGVPQDLYNVGRSELSSGANSILFGMGSQGGILSLSSKTADAQRNRLSVKYTIGTWTSPAVSGIPYQRATFDYNLVLKPRTLGFRLLALWQDGGNQSWREWVNDTQKRINPLIYIKPFKNTIINLSYEGGSQHNSTYYNWNASDALSAWFASGRQTMTGFGAAYQVPGTAAINAGANGNPDFVYNQDNGIMYNFRQSYQSTSQYTLANKDTSQNAPVRLPASLSSYYYNPVGPGGIRSQNFEDWSAVLQQNLGPLSLELAYFHNNNQSIAHAPTSTDMPLRGDPNAYISPANWGGGTPDTVLPNIATDGTPYTGRLYMEDNWRTSYLNERNNVYRLTADYNLNLKKYGNHRIIALIERSENRTFSNLTNEILVDNNQQAISNITDPTGGANQITRRHYVTEGDFSTYYGGDWRTPIDNIVVGNKIYHSAYVTAKANLSDVKAATDSLSLTLQSSWFNNRLSTIIGGRVDDVNYRQALRSLVTDPNDPRILNKTNVLNEWAFNGAWAPPNHYLPYTFTTGAVYHIPLLQDRISAFANFSTNRGTPYFDSRTVLPNGALPNLSRGTSTDYGLMFDILGDGKWFIRASHFDTRQYGDPAISMNTANPTNVVLASTDLYNIYDALFFLTPTGQTARPTTNSGIWPNGTGPGKGPMTPEQYAVMPPTPDQPWGTPPLYNAATTDVRSQGYEVELTGNPTKSITLRFVFSYSNRQRTNVMPEIFDFFNQHIPDWLDMASRTNPDTNLPYIVTTVNANGVVTAQTPLYDYVQNELDTVRNKLLIQLLRQSGAMAARPYKFNITGKYTFQNGDLKGLALGGALRYQSPNLMPASVPLYPDSTSDNPLGINPGAYQNGSSGMVKGTSLTFWDAFVIYKRKLFGGRTTATFQLNVMNVFNQNVITGGRVLQFVDQAGNTSVQLRRTYVNPPRTYRLSAQFDF